MDRNDSLERTAGDGHQRVEFVDELHHQVLSVHTTPADAGLLMQLSMGGWFCVRRVSPPVARELQFN